MTEPINSYPDVLEYFERIGEIKKISVWNYYSARFDLEDSDDRLDEPFGSWLSERGLKLLVTSDGDNDFLDEEIKCSDVDFDNMAVLVIDVMEIYIQPSEIATAFEQEFGDK